MKINRQNSNSGERLAVIGLKEAKGCVTGVTLRGHESGARRFNLKPGNHKRLLSFLRKYESRLPFNEQ
jgi:hypothetical protein